MVVMVVVIPQVTPQLLVQPIPPTSNQYYSQDVLGQTQFGYAFPGQASANYLDPLGNQMGSYAYYDPNGKEVRVSYTADSQGFRVLSNDLPVAVQETPEVAMARASHMAAKAAALARRSGLPFYPYPGVTGYPYPPFYGGNI